jgi:hypothetical protein
VQMLANEYALHPVMGSVISNSSRRIIPAVRGSFLWIAAASGIREFRLLTHRH